MGTTITTPPIVSVNYSNLGIDLLKAQLLETLTYAAETTKTSGTLTAFNKYLVIMNVSLSTGGNVYVRFDGDSGANYAYVHIINTTITNTAGATEISVYGNAASTQHAMIVFIVNGVSAPVASGTNRVSVMNGGVGAGTSSQTQFGGNYTHGNAQQIQTITLLSGANLTGTAQIYGMP